MKAASLRDIKTELKEQSHAELLQICLRMAKFKKDSKELLSYLLFEASDEASFIQSLKEEMDEQFDAVNRQNYYFITKGIRKILSSVKKHIRFSQQKETEIELLIYFCRKLNDFRARPYDDASSIYLPKNKRSQALENIFYRQIEMIKKKSEKLHEDLQYDIGVELAELIEH